MFLQKFKNIFLCFFFVFLCIFVSFIVVFLLLLKHKRTKLQIWCTSLRQIAVSRESDCHQLHRSNRWLGGMEIRVIQWHCGHWI